MGQSKHPETKLKLSDGYGAIKIDEIKEAVEGIKKIHQQDQINST